MLLNAVTFLVNRLQEEGPCLSHSSSSFPDQILRRTEPGRHLDDQLHKVTRITHQLSHICDHQQFNLLLSYSGEMSVQMFSKLVNCLQDKKEQTMTHFLRFKQIVCVCGAAAHTAALCLKHALARMWRVQIKFTPRSPEIDWSAEARGAGSPVVWAGAEGKANVRPKNRF